MSALPLRKSLCISHTVTEWGDGAVERIGREPVSAELSALIRASLSGPQRGRLQQLSIQASLDSVSVGLGS